MGVKFYVYQLTGSSAILSDALESIINVVASAFALGSILLAAKPPDESHPYGHGKIEYFSAGFEGSLIVFAALGIFKAGFSHLLNPRPLPNLQEGLFILMGASMINLVLGLGLVRVGKRTNSLILIADGKHVLTDVYTSGGVLIGLFLVHLTGWYWLDGTIACLVGLNILITGASLVRQSFARLMDASEPELLNALSQLFTEHRKDIWIDIHQLRALRSGNFVHVDLHLILPRNLTLEESHREAKELEKIIENYLNGQAGVLIHMDPCVDQDCPLCSRHLCELRKKESQCQMLWNTDTLTMNGGVGERLQELPQKLGITSYEAENFKKT